MKSPRDPRSKQPPEPPPPLSIQHQLGLARTAGYVPQAGTPKMPSTFPGRRSNLAANPFTKPKPG